MRKSARSHLRCSVLPPVRCSRLVLRAIDTAGQHRVSVWDAMVIEAAAEAACDQLWSEDLAHGRTVRGVRVVNPFED